ncbi:MAG: isopentenyl-diphosphate Delta-isomerase [Hyphomonadaceae bacterium]|jgi:isopentenyl-diphosphate delta-isomerase|nr:isopentenyl-diphosphate Delta-isomerase [Hyphomonadaceae bacterium]
MAGTWKAPSGGLQVSADTSADAVILVDADDRAIGTMAKLEAHRRGLLHRAVSVFVLDSSNRVLLQQRAPGKYHSGGLWTNTCCSHPRPGEGVAKAGARRLVEEMGVACSLTSLFQMRYRAQVSNGLVEHELVHVLIGRFDGAPAPNPSEVMAWRWMAPTEIARDVDKRPDAYTVWFQKYCRDYWDLLSTRQADTVLRHALDP